MSNETKAVSRSVTMLESLWDVTDAHAASDPLAGDRSSYIRRLVTADLQAAGMLPGSAEAAALAEARDLLQTIGAVRFRETLRAAALASA